jgi:hypothetical protein
VNSSPFSLAVAIQDVKVLSADQFRFLRYCYTFGAVTLIVKKGSDRYSCRYVVDENGKYLSKGYDSQTAAAADASGIARRIRAEAIR